MTATTVGLAVFTLVAGTAAAVVETSGRPGYGTLKMAAAASYLAFALSLDALDSTYGRIVFVALVLSAAGDFLLINDSRRSFVAGLGAFLLAHVVLAVAFAFLNPSLVWIAAGLAVMGAIAYTLLRWLDRAGLEGTMKRAVIAYLLAITAMVAVAAGTRWPRLAVGAFAFAVSDIFVARQRFVVRAALNRRLGLPIYFAAQLLIASTV